MLVEFFFFCIITSDKCLYSLTQMRHFRNYLGVPEHNFLSFMMFDIVFTAFLHVLFTV